MKTFRKSLSVRNRYACRELSRCGRAGGARTALLASDVVLADRRLHCAYRLAHVEAARLEVLVRNADGILVKPTVTLHTDPLTRLVTGFMLTTD